MIHEPEVLYRCMGCAGTHSKCTTQQEAESLLHRLADLLDHLSHTGPGPSPGVQSALDEYEERFR